MMNQQNNGNKQPFITVLNLGLPGLSNDARMSIVTTILGVYGIGHNAPFTQATTIESYETGNAVVDSQINNDVFRFKMIADGLTSDYAKVHCAIIVTAIGVSLTFTCE